MRTKVYFVGAVIWMALIFYLSSLPGSMLGSDAPALNAIKKIGHFTVFGVLAVLYLYALKGDRSLRGTGGAIYLLSLVLSIIYAVSDEYHQSFVPGRHAAITDVLIDSVARSRFSARCT